MKYDACVFLLKGSPVLFVLETYEVEIMTK